MNGATLEQRDARRLAPGPARARSSKAKALDSDGSGPFEIDSMTTSTPTQ